MATFATTGLFSRVTPAPSGDGGIALNDNFALLDRLLMAPAGIQSTTASTSILAATRLMLVDDTAGSLTQNLPAIASAYQMVRVMKTSAAANIVYVNSTDTTINGTSANPSISVQYGYLDFYPSTSGWYSA